MLQFRATKNLHVRQCFRLSSCRLEGVIDGVTYVRSRDAARAVDLAPDYVSRLARQGTIPGKRVAGSGSSTCVPHRSS